MLTSFLSVSDHLNRLFIYFLEKSKTQHMSIKCWVSVQAFRSPDSETARPASTQSSATIYYILAITDIMIALLFGSIKDNLSPKTGLLM